MTNNWTAIQKAFDELSLLSGKQRESALEKLRTNDPEVYKEVADLLGQEFQLHSIFGNNPFGDWSFFEDEGLINSIVGPYRLTKLLGYGGMGSVFLAEREDKEFDQEVAIKLVRPRKYSEATVNRFKEERQILAKLNHPNIGRLYDGGSMDDGRMYFTMEYLPWQDVEAYIEEKKPSLTDRLNLFKSIAHGIGHAHSQLVLHLDIKPKNILVSEKGNPKILDFGISQRFLSSEEKPNIETDVIPTDNRYTMAFASPEQLNNSAVSTQSDIYSLGSLLYFLITDQLPFGKNDTTREAYLENVMSGKFIPPSHVASKNRDLLKTDLDAICKKALSLDPTERYASVDLFIRDIENFQIGLPISILEEDRIYRFKKFIKRNKIIATLSTIAMATIIGLTIYYTINLTKERNIAIAESAKSQTLTEMLTEIFSLANPYENQGAQITVESLLDNGAANLENKFNNEPEIKASLMTILGQVYNGVNNYEKGDSLIQLALDLNLNTPNISSKNLSLSYYEAANSNHDLGNFDLATSYIKKADSLYQIVKRQNISQYDPFHQANIYHLKINNFDQMGYFAQADSLIPSYLNLIEENAIGNDQRFADALLICGSVKRHMGKFEEARIFYKKCLTMQEALHDAPHSELAITLNHLTSLYYNTGEYEKGIETGKESLKQRKAIFGTNHRETVASASNLARIYSANGNVDKALNNYVEILEILKTIYKEPHPYHVAIMSTIGHIYRNKKNYDEAIRHYDLATLTMEKIGGDKNPRMIIPLLGGKGILYLAKNQFATAKIFLSEALSTCKNAYGDDHPETTGNQYLLGKCLFKMGEKEKGMELLELAQSKYQVNSEKWKVQLADIKELLAQ